MLCRVRKQQQAYEGMFSSSGYDVQSGILWFELTHHLPSLVRPSPLPPPFILPLFLSCSPFPLLHPSFPILCPPPPPPPPPMLSPSILCVQLTSVHADGMVMIWNHTQQEAVCKLAWAEDLSTPTSSTFSDDGLHIFITGTVKLVVVVPMSNEIGSNLASGSSYNVQL